MERESKTDKFTEREKEGGRENWMKGEGGGLRRWYFGRTETGVASKKEKTHPGECCIKDESKIEREG